MPKFMIEWSKAYFAGGVEEVDAADADAARAYAEEHIGDWEGSMQYDPDQDMINVYPMWNELPEVEAVIEDTYDDHYEIEVHDCPYCGDDHRHHIGHALADAEHIVRAECDGGLYRFTL